MSVRQESMCVIAVVGHANAGKTSIVRTLVKHKVGLVADKPGATPTQQISRYPRFQAQLVDCPGFQCANIISHCMQSSKKKNLESELMKLRKDKKFNHDFEAIDAISNSDIAIYVANAETAPGNPHDDELSLVTCIQPNVIGVLNKAYSVKDNDKFSHKSNLANRRVMWGDIFRKYGIQSCEFDSSFGSPRELEMLHELLATIISDEKRDVFNEDLAEYRKSRRDLRERACADLVDCVVTCASAIKGSIIEGYISDVAREKLVGIVSEARINHLNSVPNIYVDTSLPAQPRQQHSPEIHAKKPSTPSAIAKTAGVTTISTAVGGGLASTVALVVSASTVPYTFLSTLPVAIGIGGPIGAAVGAVIAAWANFLPQKVAQLSNDSIKGIVKDGVAIIWAASHHSYVFQDDPISALQGHFSGNADAERECVSPTRVEDLREAIEVSFTVNPIVNNLDWGTASRAEIYEACMALLDEHVM